MKALPKSLPKGQGSGSGYNRYPTNLLGPI